MKNWIKNNWSLITVSGIAATGIVTSCKVDESKAKKTEALVMQVCSNCEHTFKEGSGKSVVTINSYDTDDKDRYSTNNFCKQCKPNYDIVKMQLAWNELAKSKGFYITMVVPHYYLNQQVETDKEGKPLPNCFTTNITIQTNIVMVIPNFRNGNSNPYGIITNDATMPITNSVPTIFTK